MFQRLTDRFKKLYHRLDASFYLVFAAATIAILILTGKGLDDNSNKWSFLALYTGDAVFMTIPFWWLSKRYKWVTVVLMWVLALFACSLTLYYSYWHNTYPFAQIFDTASYNAFVFGSVPDLWSWRESAIIAFAALYTLAFFLFFRKRSRSFTLRIKIWLTVVSVLYYVFCAMLINIRTYRWYKNQAGTDVSLGWVLKHNFSRLDMNVSYFQMHGMVYYVIAHTVMMFDTDGITLTSQQADDIKAFISDINSDPVFSPSALHADSAAIAANNGKNLIIIVVESLNSPYIGLEINNRKVTPVLDSLLADSSTLSCLTMVSQIKDGCSSDGQLMYNTGLFPLNIGSAAMLHADNPNFPSLPKILAPRYSAEFICEQADSWNHRNTSRAYGYDKLYDCDSLAAYGSDPAVVGRDKAVLDVAADQMALFPQPFVAFITTLSMHYPFNDDAVPPLDSMVDPDRAMVENNYIRMLHFFDNSLGRFISRIKQLGLYDNSVIVIASDHCMATLKNDVTNSDNIPIALIVLNSGVSGQITSPVGQIDVYPTLLDIMGVRVTKGNYRGVGHSLLRYDVTGTVKSDGTVTGDLSPEQTDRIYNAWLVSDLIIRSHTDF